MIRKMLFTVILVCFYCSAAFAQTADTMVWVATPSIVTPATIPEYPEEPTAFDTVSMTQTEATTTAIVVTALTGRKQITFSPTAIRASSTATIYIGVGTTTVEATTGFPYTFESGPLTLKVDGTVPMSYITPTAATFTVLQEGRKAIGFKVGKQQ